MWSVGSQGGPAGVGGWSKAMGGVREARRERSMGSTLERKRNETVAGSATEPRLRLSDRSWQDRDRGKDVV